MRGIRPYHARLRDGDRALRRHGREVRGRRSHGRVRRPRRTRGRCRARACEPGLSILQAIAQLNDADPNLDLQVRIGINTGEAVVAIGARCRSGARGLVTGDVVNTAARIQSVAPVNCLAVGEATHRATSHVFEYEPLAPVEVKGKSGAARIVAREGRRVSASARTSPSTPLRSSGVCSRSLS